MRRAALWLIATACTREAPPPPAPAVTPKPVDAAPVDAPVDAAPVDAATLDAAPVDAGTPGGVRGRVMARSTTPGGSPAFPVQGCVVKVTDDATQEPRATKTDAQGRYRVELAPGRYTVDLSDCMRGYLDCGTMSQNALRHAEIAGGTWRTLDLTTLSCTRCLDASARIATPGGEVAIDRLRAGDRILVVRPDGTRAVAHALAVQRVPVAGAATAHRLVLADGRTLVGSSPHPLADGRALGALRPGDIVDGARVVAVEPAPYTDGHAYDVLPSIDGAYLADGIPLRSTISR